VNDDMEAVGSRYARRDRDTVDNPRNADVRGMPLARVRVRLPGGSLTTWRVTPAPPLARPLGRVHPALIRAFNLLPLRRTHRLAWIERTT
jgi:hypothetical protein